MLGASEEETAIEEEESGGMLPKSIVVIFQTLSIIWELMNMSLIALAWQLIIWAYVAFDFVTDQVIRLLIGSICAPCAWVFIWLLKIPTLPLVLLGYFFRIYFEIMGLMVDGWMLFFGGSGCFLRFGHDCWF